MRYSPIAKNQAVYNELYALNRLLHDAFGGEPLSDLAGIFCNGACCPIGWETKTADLSRVMKELIRIKEEQAH